MLWLLAFSYSKCLFRAFLYQLVFSEPFCDELSSVQLLLLLQSSINSKPSPLKIITKLISNPFHISFSYAIFQNTSIHSSFLKPKKIKGFKNMQNHTFSLWCDSYSIICKSSTKEFQFWSHFSQTPWKNRDVTNPNSPEGASALNYPFLNSSYTV